MIYSENNATAGSRIAMTGSAETAGARRGAIGSGIRLRSMVNTAHHRTVAHEILMEVEGPNDFERHALAEGRDALSLEVSRRVAVVHRLLESHLLGEGHLLFLPIKPYLPGVSHQGLGPILDSIESCALPPDQLVLQIEEAPGHGDLERVRLLTHTFRRRGYQVAISGFGGGFNGLKELLECPPDFVRLSADLTSKLLVDRAQRSVVKALAGLAQDLQLPLVADGVNSAEVAGLLHSLQIVLQQGPHYGAPKALDVVIPGLGQR